MLFQYLQAQCTVTKLHSIFHSPNSDTSNEIPIATKKPKCVPGGMHALVTISVEFPVLIECFEACKSLGRFALRAKGKTVAVGICEKCY